MQQDTDVFSSTSRPSYKSIVAQIEQLKVRALAPTDYEDVITLIEYVRNEALKLHQANEIASQTLKEREAAVSRREHDVKLRSRAVEAAIAVKPRKRRYLFG
jgi:hypothetical protein